MSEMGHQGGTWAARVNGHQRKPSVSDMSNPWSAWVSGAESSKGAGGERGCPSLAQSALHLVGKDPLLMPIPPVNENSKYTGMASVPVLGSKKAGPPPGRKMSGSIDVIGGGAPSLPSRRPGGGKEGVIQVRPPPVPRLLFRSACRSLPPHFRIASFSSFCH